MHLNPHTIPALLCLALAITCGLFVLLQNPKAKLNSIFFCICITIAAWMSFYIPFNFATTDTFLTSWFRVSHCFVSFLPITTFTFVTTYLNVPQNLFWLRINALIGVTFCLMSLFTNWIIIGTYHITYFPYPQAGKLHFLLVLHCAYLCFFMTEMMIKKIKNKNLPPKSINQIKYVCTGVVILASGMWDFIDTYGFDLYPIGAFTSILFLVIVTAAILKHQLMDINIVIKKGLVYSILVSSVTLVYVFIVLILERLFFHNSQTYSSIPGFLTVCLMAIMFIPFRNKLHNLLDKIFLKNTAFNIAEENELLRQEIIQTERLKAVAVLASGMAHEIKNPLTAIKTFSEYLPHKTKDEVFLKKFGPLIASEANRINALVHELLDFAKPAPVRLGPANIHDLLNNTLEFLNSDFIKRKVRIKKDYVPEKSLILNLDSNQFKQALLNILLNAIDAMPSGGEISITTTIVENKALIKIQDTGTGISKEDLGHIFDPFFSKKDSGTGLGLAITHEIIKNHNGKIFVESQPGTGTTFIIELPYAMAL